MIPAPILPIVADIDVNARESEEFPSTRGLPKVREEYRERCEQRRRRCARDQPDCPHVALYAMDPPRNTNANPATSSHQTR